MQIEYDIVFLPANLPRRLQARTKFISGYDHAAKCHFEGTVKDQTVQLYDHSESRYFDYGAV